MSCLSQKFLQDTLMSDDNLGSPANPLKYDEHVDEKIYRFVKDQRMLNRCFQNPVISPEICELNQSIGKNRFFSVERFKSV